jgi:hypothetical protein
VTWPLSLLACPARESFGSPTGFYAVSYMTGFYAVSYMAGFYAVSCVSGFIRLATQLELRLLQLHVRHVSHAGSTGVDLNEALEVRAPTVCLPPKLHRVRPASVSIPFDESELGIDRQTAWCVMRYAKAVLKLSGVLCCAVSCCAGAGGMSRRQSRSTTASIRL